MVRSRKGKLRYLGHGIDYIGYHPLGSEVVVKVPLGLFFEPGQDPYEVPTLEKLRRYKKGEFRKPTVEEQNTYRQVGQKLSKFGKSLQEFGVPTSVTGRGFVVQPFVRGRRPSGEQRSELQLALEQRGMDIHDLNTGNFKKTKRGYVVFDYGNEGFPLRAPQVEDMASRASARTIARLTESREPSGIFEKLKGGSYARISARLKR